ncbi:hypothetical protein K1719_014836 [Acacia pycnantha]|nr:hypothetical protein K1719_014836 [Acacia pycnantha]
MALSAHGAVYPSGSSSSAKRWKYHVFLSFRGEDTRKSFTDHLFHALQRKGIIAFRDDEELEKGHFIKPSLLEAIEESLYAIVVISANYASSAWCLDELLKILHSKKQIGLLVFPIFYGVDPSNIRHQTGNFGKTFKKLEEKFTQDKMKVQRWRDALEEVANLSGWHSDNWHETKLIETVVEEVWSKLYDELPFDLEISVGIESKLEELDSFIANGMGGVQFVGIWGTGGLGKTTLARAFYERKHKNFDAHCFLYNVREVSKTDGLISLQRKLLSSLHKRSIDVSNYYEGRKLIKNMCNRKVLLVLDDVSEITQLENLAGKQGWFGEGSIILVTTRDKHVLSSYDVSIQYDMKFLSDDESLELYHQNAFKGKKPKKDYLELSRTMIQYAKGLPLVLKVLGSFLCRRSVLEWKDAIAKFSKVLPNDVLKILQVSCEGLDDDEKNIFLDIACFFKGKRKDYVIQTLQNLGLHPIVGIKVLIDKSLVIIDDKGILSMHDILQEMGKTIVFQESPNDAGKRSTIWSLEDANSVLEGKKGSEAIHGIVLRLDQESVSYWDPKAFSKMSNLKLLIITSCSGDPQCILNLPYGLECFSSALKVLQWNRFCLDYLPSYVSHEKFIDLKMKPSPSKQISQGSQASGRLKFMDLSYSKYLIKTPNFDEIPYLQNLILEGCINLVEVHPSLGCHHNLVIVNLKGCKSIKTLPSKFEMKCLESLILSGCLQIRRLPEFGKSMKCLSKLDVGETGITKLPQSLVNLCQLVDLNLRNCKNLVCLPNEIHCVKSIKILNISGCPKLSRLPENLNENVALEELDASGTAIKEVPSSILHLKNLRSLSFSGCTGLQSSSPNLSSFWTRFFRLTRPSIHSGLLLPPSLSGLSNLKELNLSYCNLSDESLPNDINALSSLATLYLSGNNFVNLPVGFFSNLLKLDRVFFNHCTRLQSFPRLPSNLVAIQAIDCPSMKYILGSQEMLLWKIFEQLEYQERYLLQPQILHPFFMNIGGSEVPSWFHNQNCFCDDAWPNKPNVSFIANIQDHHHSSKQFGIAVCLVIEGHYGASASYDEDDQNPAVSWICRNVGDEIPNEYVGHLINKRHNDRNQLFLFFFTCVDKKRLQISFHVDKSISTEANFEIKKCGWRVLCKEDIEAWRRTRGEGCSSSNKCSDNYHNYNELGATEATSDSLSNYQSINGSEEEDGQSNVNVDIQMPLTKRRKL